MRFENMQIIRLKYILNLAIVGLVFSITACDRTTINTSKDGDKNERVSIAKVDSKQHHGGTSGYHNMSMDLGVADEQYDLRFIDSMIPHHQGAIDMAKEVLQKTKRPEIKQLAEKIITAQNKEIEQMKQWRESWYPNTDGTPIMWHSQMNHSMPMSDEHRESMMMSVDLGDADDEFDLRFINAMIPHHEGALTMAKDTLKKTKRMEIKELAQSILISQQTEIDEMKKLRKNWYGK